MHAVAITAYTDFDQLRRLAKRLDPSFFITLIHIDARSTEIGEAEIGVLRDLGCQVIRSFKIKWGTLSHLQALLRLIQIAISKDHVEYVHLVSGQDYPVASVADFKRICDGRIFLNHRRTAEREDVHYYFQYDLLSHLTATWRFLGPIYRATINRSIRLQQKLGVKRRRFGPYAWDEIHEGLVWSSLPREAAVSILESPKSQSFLRALRFTRVPEELFLQTYFLNSELAALVVNDSLHYQDWTRKHQSVPAILDDDDVEAVLRSNALFARKLTSAISSSFANRIDERVFGERTQSVA